MSETHDPLDERDLELHWSTELDRLELELMWTERLLRVAEPIDRVGWSPHQPQGPLPGHLVARARDIAQRQVDLQARLVQALSQLDQERRFTVSQSADDRPRYIDLVG
jgi:hypothetical protein